MPSWLVVNLVVVFRLIIVRGLSSKVLETRFCSIVGLSRISEARGWQPKSVLDLNSHCCT